MLFNSPVFLFLFLPGTVAAYILLRQLAGPRAVLGLLIAVSLLFYGWWNPLYVPLLGSLAVFNFLVARAMAAQRRAGRPDLGSWLLTFGIVGDLLALAYFKYTDFLIDTANTLLQTDFTLQYVLLPIGIHSSPFRKSPTSSTAAAARSPIMIFLNTAFSSPSSRNYWLGRSSSTTRSFHRSRGLGRSGSSRATLSSG